jgi:hypothetical protein
MFCNYPPTRAFSVGSGESQRRNQLCDEQSPLKHRADYADGTMVVDTMVACCCCCFRLLLLTVFCYFCWLLAPAALLLSFTTLADVAHGEGIGTVT